MPCKWHAAARAKEALEKQLEQQRQAKRDKYLEQEQKELRRKERHEQHCMEMHDRRCGRTTRQGAALQILAAMPRAHFESRQPLVRLYGRYGPVPALRQAV